jgi:hypothetical protein
MDKMTPAQRASFDRSIKRAVARSGNDEDEKLGLFIRVAESRIYKGQMLLKALLKEVIFLRLHDLHDGDLRIPKGTPWSKDYRLYEGWCYASQEYLANRVGCVREAANRGLKKIVKDGYLKPRKWRGKNGSWHKQYFPDEFAIDAAIAELGSASSSASHDKSDGTPSDLGSPTLVTVDHVPSDLGSHGHVIVSPHPRDLRSQQVVSEGGAFRGVDLVRSLSTPPSGIVKDVTPPKQEKAKPNPVGALSTQAKKETKPKAKPNAKPTPFQRCENPDCLELLVPGESHECREAAVFDEEEA